MGTKKIPSLKRPGQNWPADHVERRKVKDLIPYARNSRTHSPEQVAQIAASIEEWGFANPVLIAEDGTIIAGHGRVLAAKKLGLAEVPVMVAAGWSEDQKRAYVIADNKLTLNGGWDNTVLKAEFADLSAAGFDLGKLGFTAPELAAVRDVRPAGLTDPDEAPEPPADPVAARGDLWALGRHRLMCGDSTNAEDVGPLLDGAKPHLMVTDPPYGVEYDPNWRNEASRWAGSNVKLGASAIGKVMNDGQADWREAWVLFPGAVAYVWHAALKSGTVAASLVSSGFDLRSQIIWDKMRLVIGRGNYHWQHEPCWYAVRKGTTGQWAGGRKQTTLWEIPKSQTSETGHGTQKPVECMKRPIENNSRPGDAVYDPFLGSGTTLIAAEMTGRRCYGLELSPAYCDVIIQRWQAFTGLTATLDGVPFDKVAQERRKKAD